MHLFDRLILFVSALIRGWCYMQLLFDFDYDNWHLASQCKYENKEVNISALLCTCDGIYSSCKHLSSSLLCLTGFNSDILHDYDRGSVGHTLVLIGFSEVVYFYDLGSIWISSTDMMTSVLLLMINVFYVSVDFAGI